MTTRLLKIGMFAFGIGLAAVAFADPCTKCTDGCDGLYARCIAEGGSVSSCALVKSVCYSECPCG